MTRILVCGNQSHFEDDHESVCSVCGSLVYFRPYVKDIAFKLCLVCGRRMIYTNATPEEIEIPPQAFNEISGKIKITS